MRPFIWFTFSLIFCLVRGLFGTKVRKAAWGDYQKTESNCWHGKESYTESKRSGICNFNIARKNLFKVNENTLEQ